MRVRFQKGLLNNKRDIQHNKQRNKQNKHTVAILSSKPSFLLNTYNMQSFVAWLNTLQQFGQHTLGWNATYDDTVLGWNATYDDATTLNTPPTTKKALILDWNATYDDAKASPRSILSGSMPLPLGCSRRTIKN